jgi:nucleoside 2-deoxyribosyltransferase
MSKKKIYLAGPISGLTFEQSTEWRNEVKKMLAPSIDGFSPMRGKEQLKREAVIVGAYGDDPLTSIDGINVRDHNDVRTSDAILVNFLGAKTVSIGTVMEIAWAQELRKPTVIVMETDNIHRHCILEYGAIVVDNLMDGVQIINEILLP